MPRNSVAAKRYALAFFSIVKSDSGMAGLQTILSELKLFNLALDKADDGVAFFFNPVISIDDKVKVLDELMKALPNIHSFLITLVKERRLDCLKDIIDDFARLCEKAAGELAVNLELAHPLPDATVDEIKHVLETKWKSKIKIKTSVNPELIAGFVAKAPGRIMDASVSAQLENLEHYVFS